MGEENKKLNQDDFEIHECQAEDIPLVMNINERTLPENYPSFFYKQILDKYQHAFLLATINSNKKDVAGYIMWRLEQGNSSFSPNNVTKSHLVSLAVLPEFRNNGIARELLDLSMERMKRHEISEYVLEVRVSNINAIDLYLKHYRFEKIKIISKYYRDGEDAFYMAKNIDNLEEYILGTENMSNEEIIEHYENSSKKYLCYTCPQCNSLYLKSLYFTLPGSIHTKDSTTIICPKCKNSISLYNISQGDYDIQ